MHAQALQSAALVTREDRDGVAILRLNRPDALNALSPQLLAELEAQITTLETAPDIHGIILTGTGEKAFCAGADIAAMAGLTAVQARDWGRRGQRLTFKIQYHPKPVVAAINGYALGGGLELAMACDWIMAVPGTKVGQPEATIGVVPGFLGTQRLARLVGAHAAKWLCMSGEAIPTEEAHRLGLVTHLVPRERLLDEAVRLMNKIHANAPMAVRLCKELVNRGLDMPLEGGAALELDAFALTFATRDQKEGMSAFVEKRKPNYTGQ